MGSHSRHRQTFLATRFLPTYHIGRHQALGVLSPGPLQLRHRNRDPTPRDGPDIADQHALSLAASVT